MMLECPHPGAYWSKPGYILFPLALRQKNTSGEDFRRIRRSKVHVNYKQYVWRPLSSLSSPRIWGSLSSYTVYFIRDDEYEYLFTEQCNVNILYIH